MIKRSFIRIKWKKNNENKILSEVNGLSATFRKTGLCRFAKRANKMHQKKLQFDKTLIDDNDQENIILIKAVD